MPSPTLKIDGQGFTETKKIVGFVTHPEKTSTDAAHAAAESDRIAALFFDLQIDVDRRFGWTWLDLSVLVLDLFEVAELIQPQETEVPQRRIENLAFLNHDFAPDNFVACCGIAGKGDPVNSELSVFIKLSASQMSS